MFSCISLYIYYTTSGQLVLLWNLTSTIKLLYLQICITITISLTCDSWYFVFRKMELWDYSVRYRLLRLTFEHVPDIHVELPGIYHINYEGLIYHIIDDLMCSDITCSNRAKFGADLLVEQSLLAGPRKGATMQLMHCLELLLLRRVIFGIKDLLV